MTGTMSSPAPRDEYFSGKYDATSVVTTICMALSLYNALELILLIFTTFKEFHGLYFWSLLIATFGVIPYCIGLMVEYFELTYSAVGKALDGSGWIMMITGQSFVLYSRLGLILDNPTILRSVKWMVITNAIVFHSMTEVLNFCANFGPSHSQTTCGEGYFYVEKIQMTIFCLQEFIISGIYVWKTFKLLKVVSQTRPRQVMWQLFSINVIIIIMDIALLVIAYKNWHVLEQTLKSFIYSVKVKLEFAILGNLVELVRSSKRSLSKTLLEAENFIDPSRTGSVVTKIKTNEDTRPQWMIDFEKSNNEHDETPAQLNGNIATRSIPNLDKKDKFTDLVDSRDDDDEVANKFPDTSKTMMSTLR